MRWLALATIGLFLSGCSGHPSNSSPRPATTPATAATALSPDEWAALRSRPLKVEALRPGQDCPKAAVTNPTSFTGSALGSGPAYAVGASGSLAAKELMKILWEVSPTYLGPLVIRGHRLDASGYLLLDAANGNHSPLPFQIITTVGGQDWRMNSELDFSAAGTPTGGPWRGWPSYTFAAAPGCYAWQIDGTSFSETIVAPFH